MGKGGQHLQLSMMDAVVSFLWADSAANEVLLASDGTQNSSFVAGFNPIRFEDGWGIVTPTSDADFAGMCKALDVEGYDDPRVATIAERVKHRELSSSLVEAVGLFEEYEHHVVGPVRMPRHPTRFLGTPATLTTGSPALGQHTDEVLAEIGLGDRIAELRSMGAVS
jgi:crotonobetainyl-CoA:carnitine CoA-transferase CaiB-like acyl-CoA transferase